MRRRIITKLMRFITLIVDTTCLETARVARENQDGIKAGLRTARCHGIGLENTNRI
jgi:signal transduction histidine kinase